MRTKLKYPISVIECKFSDIAQLSPNVKQGKRKVQGVPQSQTAALSRHQEEEKTDKSKQAQISLPQAR